MKGLVAALLVALAALAAFAPARARADEKPEEALRARRGGAPAGRVRRRDRHLRGARRPGLRPPRRELRSGRRVRHALSARRPIAPGDLGRAAAAFEEALLLRPGDRDADAALDLVRAEVTRRRARRTKDAIDVRPTLDRVIVGLAGEQTWGLAAFAASLALALGLVLRPRAGRAHIAGSILVPTAIVALAALVPLAWGAHALRLSTRPGVIVATEVYLTDDGGPRARRRSRARGGVGRGRASAAARSCTCAGARPRDGCPRRTSACSPSHERAFGPGGCARVGGVWVRRAAIRPVPAYRAGAAASPRDGRGAARRGRRAGARAARRRVLALRTDAARAGRAHLEDAERPARRDGARARLLPHARDLARVRQRVPRRPRRGDRDGARRRGGGAPARRADPALAIRPRPSTRTTSSRWSSPTCSPSCTSTSTRRSRPTPTRSTSTTSTRIYHVVLIEVLALSYAVRAPANWAMPVPEFSA